MNPPKRSSSDKSPMVRKDQLIAESYSGPIPPASELEKFHQIDRSLPDRIIGLAEKTAETNHINILKGRENERFALENERKRITNDFRLKIVVRLVGLIIFGFSGKAVYDFLEYKNWVAVAIIIGTVALLAFVANFSRISSDD